MIVRKHYMNDKQSVKMELHVMRLCACVSANGFVYSDPFYLLTDYRCSTIIGREKFPKFVVDILVTLNPSVP